VTKPSQAYPRTSSTAWSPPPQSATQGPQSSTSTFRVRSHPPRPGAPGPARPAHSTRISRLSRSTRPLRSSACSVHPAVAPPPRCVPRGSARRTTSVRRALHPQRVRRPRRVPTRCATTFPAHHRPPGPSRRRLRRMRRRRPRGRALAHDAGAWDTGRAEAAAEVRTCRVCSRTWCRRS